MADGVLWLRMPLPFGLDHINLYLLRHGEGWVVVDTGLAVPRSREVWEKVFVEDMGRLPVLAVVCTHFHFDHSGLAAWLTERFRCPLYMTRGEFQALYVTPDGREPGWEFHDFYRRAGLDDEQIASLLPTIEGMRFDGGLPRSYRRLRDGDWLKIGGRHWQVVLGAGHSPEHACLFSKDDPLLIAGDQVLPRITSSVLVGANEPMPIRWATGWIPCAACVPCPTRPWCCPLTRGRSSVCTSVSTNCRNITNTTSTPSWSGSRAR